MKVTVVGKVFRKGTSKTNGLPFAKNVVYVTYREDGVDGLRVKEVWLKPEIFPLDDFKVGAVYDFDYNARGYINSITLAR